MTLPTRRPTRQRRAIAEALSQQRDFASAQELHAQLMAVGDKVGLATVYRTLQAMASDDEVDVIHGPDGQATYRMCSPTHHHHLICRECGLTIEIEGPAESWVERIAREQGFSEVEHTLELFGRCAACTKAGSGSAAAAGN